MTEKVKMSKMFEKINNAKILFCPKGIQNMCLINKNDFVISVRFKN